MEQNQSRTVPDIDWQEIMDSLEAQKCVLFPGNSAFKDMMVLCMISDLEKQIIFRVNLIFLVRSVRCFRSKDWSSAMRVCSDFCVRVVFLI